MGTLGVTNKIGLHGEDMIWAPPSRWVRSTRSRWRYKRMYGQDRYHAAAQGTPLLRMSSTSSLLATTLANQLTGFSFATCPWWHPPLGGLVAPRVLGLPVRAPGPCEAPRSLALVWYLRVPNTPGSSRLPTYCEVQTGHVSSRPYNDIGQRGDPLWTISRMGEETIVFHSFPS